MEHVRLSLGIILLLLMVIFTAQNAEVVNLNLFFWSFSISRALMVFLVLAIGILMGWSAAIYHYSKKRASASSTSLEKKE